MAAYRTRSAAPSAPAVRRSARLTERTAAPSKVTKTTKAPAKPRAKPVKYECTACGDVLIASKFPNYCPTDTCEHYINTCITCLREYLRVRLDNSTYDNIRCPECPQLMQNAGMKAFASRGVYQRFDELERRGISDKIPGWRWCLNSECRSGQVHTTIIDISDDEYSKAKDSRLAKLSVSAAPRSTKGKPKSKGKGNAVEKTLPGDILTCNACGHKSCVPCDRPWHESETCKQYQMRVKKEDAASEKFIKTKCKKCPNIACRKAIEKNGGCDSMYCLQCNTQFCWLCLTNYNDINVSGHSKGCMYAQPGRYDPHAVQQQQAGPILGPGLFLVD